MSMSMDLPDVSEEEWRKYQARLFAEQANRASQAMTFRAHVSEPLMAQTMEAMVPLPQPPPPMPMPAIPPPMPMPAQPPPSAFPATQAPLGGMGGVGDRQTGNAPDPSSLISQLTSMEQGQTPGQLPGPPQNAGSWFDGADPTKRSFFGQAQDTYQKAADDARASGFSQTPVVGGALTGIAQGAANVMGGFSGSAQALREGNPVGGVMGAVNATINAPSDVARGVSTELQMPEQILPGIDPSTPVLGGLNSPREWLPIATNLLPATALENAAGGIVGKAGNAAWKGMKGPQAAAKFMEMAKSVMPESLESMGARMGGAQSGISSGAGRLDPDTGAPLIMKGDFSDRAEAFAQKAQQELSRYEPGSKEAEYFDTLARHFREPETIERGAASQGETLDALLDEVYKARGPWEEKYGLAASRADSAAGHKGYTDGPNFLEWQKTRDSMLPWMFRTAKEVEAGGIDRFAMAQSAPDQSTMDVAKEQLRKPGGISSAIEGAMSSTVGPGANLAKTAAERQFDLAAGAAGGVAGAATAPEDATWQERTKRGVMGAAGGALLGPAGRGLLKDSSDVFGVVNKAKGGFDPERLGQRAPRRLGQIGPEDLGEGEITRAGQRLPERERIADLAQEAPELEPMRELWDEAPDLEPPTSSRPAVDALTKEALAEQAQHQSEELARVARERDLMGLPPEQGPDLADSMGRVAADDVVGGPKPEGYPQGQIAMDMEDAGGSPRSLNPLPPSYAKEGAPSLPDAPSGSGAADVTMLGKAAAAAAPGKPPLGTAFRQKLSEMFGRQVEEGDEIATLVDAEGITPRNMTAREIERLGHPNAMKALPQEVQDMATEMRDVLVDEFRYMHGGRTEAETALASQRLMPYILDIARNATPNMPVNDAMLRATRQAMADSSLSTLMARIRAQDAAGSGDAIADVLKQDYLAKAEVHSTYQLANEAMSSEQGRAFRGQRNAPEASVAQGGSSSIVQDKADQQMEDLIRLRSTTPGALQAADRIRAMMKQRAVDLKSKVRTDKKWTPEEWMELARMEKAKKWGVTDRRVGGPMEAYGLMWEDIITREPGDEAEKVMTLAEKFKYNVALEELGGRMLADKLYPDALKLDMTDGAAVRDFWLGAWNVSNRDAAQSTSVKQLMQSRAKGAPEGRLVQRWARVREDMMDFEEGTKALDDATMAPRPSEDALDSLRSQIEDIRTEMTTLRKVNPADKLDQHVALERQLAAKEAELAMGERGPGAVAGDMAPTDKRYEALPKYIDRKFGTIHEGASAVEVAEKHLRARIDFYELKLKKVTDDGDLLGIKKYKDLVKQAKFDVTSKKGLLQQFEDNYPEPLGAGQVDDAERLALKKEWMSKLDWKGHDNPWVLNTRRAISITSSNMLSTMRMLENSVMEASAILVNIPGNYFFGQADTEAAKQFLRGALGQGFGPALSNAARSFMTSSGPMESTAYLKNIQNRGTDLIRSDALTGKAAWAAPMHRGSNAISEFFQTLAYQGEFRVQALKASRADAVSPGNVTQFVKGTPAAAGEHAAGDASTLRFLEGVRDRGGMSPEDTARNLEGIERIKARQTAVPDYSVTAPISARGRTLQSFLDAPTAEMHAAAIKTAQEVASGGPHSSIAKYIGNLKAQLDLGDGFVDRAVGAGANIVFPFVYGVDFSMRAGLNIFANPVKGAKRTIEALAVGNTDLAARQAAATAMSVSTLGFLGYLAFSGSATGGGPRDPAKREALMEATDEHGDPVWRPDSLRIPVPGPGGVRHIWMAYTSMPVIAMPLNMMANGWEAFQYDGLKPDGKHPEQSDQWGAVMHAGQAMTKAFMEGSFLSGVIELANLTTGDQSQSGGRFAGEVASRFTPAGGLMRQIAYASDPNQKVAQSNNAGGFAGIPQQLAEGIPGLRNMVPNRVSPYTGGDVPTGDSWASLASPGRVYAGASPVNKMAGESLATGEFPSGFTKMQQSEGADFAGSPQSGATIRGAAREFGRSTQESAGALLNSPEYQSMTAEQKASALDHAFSEGKALGQYGAEEQSVLSPQASVEHQQEGMPKYQGVYGEPAEVASMNRKIGAARATLAKLSSQYGPQLAKMYLLQLSPEQFQLAVAYRPMSPDILYMQEQSLMAGAGATNDFLTKPMGGLDLSALPLPPTLLPSRRERM